MIKPQITFSYDCKQSQFKLFLSASFRFMAVLLHFGNESSLGEENDDHIALDLNLIDDWFIKPCVRLQACHDREQILCKALSCSKCLVVAYSWMSAHISDLRYKHSSAVLTFSSTHLIKCLFQCFLLSFHFFLLIFSSLPPQVKLYFFLNWDSLTQ